MKDKNSTTEYGRLREVFGTRYAVPTASAEAALLAALSSLASPVLGERALRACDEVIVVTPSAAVMNAAKQLQLLPVKGADSKAALEAALSPAVRAVVVSHLPNSQIDLKTVRNFCNTYELWMIEDSSEVIGASYDFDGTVYPLGTVGDIGVARCAECEDYAILTRDTMLDRLIREALGDTSYI